MRKQPWCGQWTIVSIDADETVHAAPIRCHSWACPHCARARTQRLARAIAISAPETFMTLTVSTAAHPNPERAFRLASLAVNKLIKRIRRRCPGQPVEYVLVWEITKRGWPHAHLLLRAPYIPQRWLSDQWRDLMQSPVVDVRKVTAPQQAAAYIAKYLTKGLACPAGMKRFRSSRGYFSPRVLQHLRHLTTHRSASPCSEVAADLTRRGYVVSGHPDYAITAVPLHLFLLACRPAA